MTRRLLVRTSLHRRHKSADEDDAHCCASAQEAARRFSRRSQKDRDQFGRDAANGCADFREVERIPILLGVAMIPGMSCSMTGL